MAPLRDKMSLLAERYTGKRVFVTGHTGFKGAWLTQWLAALGADVTGYALPPKEPSLFSQVGVSNLLSKDIEGDVRDATALMRAVSDASPDIVFHLAAQPLVLASYDDPVETYAVNVMGTLNLLEAVRAAGAACSVVLVTTDKVYANDDRGYAFREGDALGGHDPYSSSKAAMEVLVASWRSSFASEGAMPRLRIATARAGNVIGGGDWTIGRIVPDLVMAAANGRTMESRDPSAIRPWQHVLEPLAGYLWLGAQLSTEYWERYARAWNFGPNAKDARSVEELATELSGYFESMTWVSGVGGPARHEAKSLRLAIDLAVSELGWFPVWNFAETVSRTASWYKDVLMDPSAAGSCCAEDLRAYQEAAADAGCRWAKP